MGTKRTRIMAAGSWRRFALGSTGIGSMAVVALMVLSPIAAAGPAPSVSYKGAAFSPSFSLSNSGCGTAKAAPPHWSAKTGFGSWSGSVSAKTCPVMLNGVGSSSYANANGEITVAVPMHHATGTGGFNVTWSLLASWAEHIVTGSSATNCATTKSNYSYYYSWYSPPTWVNTTSTYSYCSISAGISLYGYASIQDMKTGMYYGPSNYWYGLNRNFDRYNNSNTYTVNYSDPAWWSNNYSSSSAYGYSHGSSGTGNITAAMSPTWFINGTFTGKDLLVLTTYISANVYASITGFKKSSAVASFNAATLGNHEDLMVVAW